MDNGTYCYDLEMVTPLGRRRGNLELRVREDDLSGTLTMFTRSIPIRGGKSSANSVLFYGDMKTLLCTIPYRAEGTLRASSLQMVLHTQQGEYPVTGVLTKGKRS